MAAFGDVLRNLGSVLNPQVERELGAEDLQRNQIAQQVGLMRLQQQFQQNSPQYQAQMEQIQNEKGFRQAASTLDPNDPLYPAKMAKAAMQFGKPEIAANLYKAQEDRAAKIQAQQDANDIKKLTLQQTHELTMSRLSGEAERRAETERHNRKMEALQAQNASMNNALKLMMLEFQQQKLGQVQDQQLQGQVKNLAKAIEGAKLNESNVVLKNAEDQIAKNPKILEYATGLGSSAPDFMLPTDVALGRQAITKVFNIDLKNRSGAAVTVPEYDRLKEEYGKGLFKTPDQLKGAIEKARTIINDHYRSVAAGFDPKVLQAYNDNLAGLGGMPVITPKGDSPNPANPSPKPRIKWGDL